MCSTVAATETIACAGSFYFYFSFFSLLAAIDSTLKRQSIESAAQLLHIVTSSAQHSIVQIWSGGSRKRRWRNPRCCYFKWLQETRAPTHVMGFPLSVPQQQDVLNMGICLFPPPFPPHPFLSLSPSRGSDSLGGMGETAAVGSFLKAVFWLFHTARAATRCSFPRRRVKGLLYIATDSFSSLPPIIRLMKQALVQGTMCQ